ncbi:MAG TPA: hypothetical protein VLA93_02005 [Pyrinomonadaceae bacterium]|nr:hypothetical protein [Pyrinomonadaceae bacterium]
MKSTTLLLLVIAFATTTFAQSGSTTLSSLNKYGGEKYQGPNRKYCLDFTAGASAERSDPCDLRYGSLYVGEDWDWFQSSADQNSRSVIKDLGALTWDEEIKVPVVTPRPKLLPGETRKITVDTSGADGADGAPGAPGADADGVVRPRQTKRAPTAERKRNDGVPKIDPIYVKAIIGHMYVTRIVDEVNDFYALFRVEAIQRGDSVLVSWRIIAPPSGNDLIK